MGLDMYLYAEKYTSDYNGGCAYPTELNAFSLAGRSCKSVTSKYKIGYWRKDWEVHEIIMRNADTDSDNTAELGVDEMKKICVELMRIIDKTENTERLEELDYSLSLFQEAIALAKNKDYDISYYASW